MSWPFPPTYHCQTCNADVQMLHVCLVPVIRRLRAEAAARTISLRAARLKGQRLPGEPS